jgi:hypothetical protein
MMSCRDRDSVVPDARLDPLTELKCVSGLRPGAGKGFSQFYTFSLPTLTPVLDASSSSAGAQLKAQRRPELL